jgi:hypothetical protein
MRASADDTNPSFKVALPLQIRPAANTVTAASDKMIIVWDGFFISWLLGLYWEELRQIPSWPMRSGRPFSRQPAV